MFQVYVPLQIQRQSAIGLGRANAVNESKGNFLENSFLLAEGWSSHLIRASTDRRRPTHIMEDNLLTETSGIMFDQIFEHLVAQPS